MDKINIGFIGGCINNQSGIDREDLYYSILLKLLSGTNQQTEYQISLGSYLSFDKLPEQTKIFINKKRLNLIFLFIRPFPLMPLQKPVVKYDTANHKVAYSFHPALFNRQMRWKEELTRYQSSNNFQITERNTFSLRDVNILGGLFLGLHHWAMKYLKHQLDLVKQLCENEKIKLIILSPPKNPESILANSICRWTTKHLGKYCETAKLNFININTFSIDNFEKDKIHFNIRGHKKLGELIYVGLTR